MNYSSDPNNLAFIEIIRHLSVKDIINLCKTNNKYSDVCRDPQVWRYLIKRDFNVEPETDDPRKEYIDRSSYPLNTNIDIFDMAKHIPTFKNEYVTYDDSLYFSKNSYQQIIALSQQCDSFDYDSKHIILQDNQIGHRRNIWLRYDPIFQPLLNAMDLRGASRIW